MRLPNRRWTGRPGNRLDRDGTFAVGLVFLTSSTSYLVTPVLAVLLVGRGIPAATAGFLIGLQLLIGRSATPLTGWLSDRVGARTLIVAGVTGSGLAHLGLAVADTMPVIVLLVVLLGVAIALFGPSSKSLAVLHSDDERRRTRVFAWRNLAVHAGVALGSLIGSALLPLVGVSRLLGVAGAMELMLALLTARLCPRSPGHVSTMPLAGIVRVLTDRRLLVLLAASSAYWALYLQLSVGAPLTLTEAGRESMLGTMFAANAIAVLALQVPSANILARARVPAEVAFMLGAAALASSLLLLPMTAGSDMAVPAFGLAVAVGVVLGAPAIDTLVTVAAPPEQLGTYLGASFVAVGIGAGIGGALGGTVHDLAVSTGRGLLAWGVMAIGLGVPALLGGWALTRARSAQPAVDVPAAQRGA